MAINTDPRQTAAYYGNRTERRPATAGTPVGRAMTERQRETVVSLVTEQTALQVALLDATPVTATVTAPMIADMRATYDTAYTVRMIQWQLNRTDVSAYGDASLVGMLIADVKALRARVAGIARKAAVPASAAATAEDGATYRAPNGSVFHCYMGQRSGRLLLKLWDATERVFSYYAAATRLPTGSVKLTTEEMQEFGRATGTCAICMRHLTDDESVARGIGPVCWSKL